MIADIIFWLDRPVYKLLFLLLLVQAAAACTERLGVRLRPDERIESAAELLQAMRMQATRLESLTASGTVDMRHGSRRVKANMTLAAKRPARVRFDTESFFDQPLSILVSDGESFSFWDMEKARFLEGKATPINLSKVIPLFLDGVEVAGIMLGDAPLIAYAKAQLDWDHDQGLYILNLSNQRERQAVFVHPIHYTPIRTTCWVDEKLSYRIYFDRWQVGSGGPPVAGKISFEMTENRIKLIMKIDRNKPNPALGDALFVLKPPAGTQVENIDEMQDILQSNPQK